ENLDSLGAAPGGDLYRCLSEGEAGAEYQRSQSEELLEHLVCPFATNLNPRLPLRISGQDCALYERKHYTMTSWAGQQRPVAEPAPGSSTLARDSIRSVFSPRVAVTLCP